MTRMANKDSTITELRTYFENKQPKTVFIRKDKRQSFELMYDQSYNLSRDIKENGYILQKELHDLKSQIHSLNELIYTKMSVSPSGGEEESMEYKGVLTQVEEINRRMGSIETNIAVIQEQTKKLNKLDSIEKQISDLRLEIPQDRQNLATKDFVKNEVNGAKLWIIVTAIGTGVAIFRLFTM